MIGILMRFFLAFPLTCLKRRHFIRITEDYARLKNVFVASVAQGGISDTLMHEVQELLTVSENNTQHFEIQ